ncbi:MAG: YggS family pyridoxal phosphate-dependent enzyme [Christensenellaceae bacterium]
MELQENIKRVQENIEKYAEMAGSDAKKIKLLAVSKTVDADCVQAAYDAGLRDFAENRVQEFLKKKEALPKDIGWNIIGQLQTNKVKYIINNGVDLIHSLDRYDLALELQKECEKKDTSISVLVQVNIAKEDSKAGIYEEDVHAFFDKIASLDRLKIKGLMTIAPYTTDTMYIRKVFGKAKKLYDVLKPKQDGFEWLSMGMSNDYGEAILEGANMLRVGSAIFGERIYK